MNDDRQIRVRFTTKIKAIRVTETPFAVPLRCTRPGLSKIINHLLETTSSIPFDFLLSETTFLRTSLEKYIFEKDISEESVLTVEYMYATQAPSQEDSMELPDWVGSLATQPTSSTFITGCYDGVLRGHVWQNTLGDVQAHNGAIKSVALSKEYCVSGGQDQGMKMWKMEMGDENKQTLNFRLLGEGTGITNSVESVAITDSASSMACGTWDGQVLVYKNPSPSFNGATKKQKKEKTTQVQPMFTGQEHSGCVASVQFAHHSETDIYSAGWDRSVKIWDYTVGSCKSTLVNTRPISDMDLSMPSNRIATAHQDHAVRIWDDRCDGGAAIAVTLRSHKEWLSSVKWCPDSDTLLISSGYGGVVKGWDIRSSVPLFTVTGHASPEKSLALGWCSTNKFISGGSDCKLKAFKTKEQEVLETQ